MKTMKHISTTTSSLEHSGRMCVVARFRQTAHTIGRASFDQAAHTDLPFDIELFDHVEHEEAEGTHAFTQSLFSENATLGVVMWAGKNDLRLIQRAHSRYTTLCWTLDSSNLASLYLHVDELLFCQCCTQADRGIEVFGIMKKRIVGRWRT